MSTRKEKSESTRNTYTPKSRGEPRGGGDVSQGEVYGQDGIVWPGYERLHSSDPGQQRWWGGGG